MTSFFGKYIRNNFPSWMHIHRYSSSNGGSILDIMGNEFEESLKDCKMNLDSFFIFDKKPLLFSKKIYNENLNNYIKYNQKVKSGTSFVKQVTCIDLNTNQPIPVYEIQSDGLKRFFTSYSDNIEIENIDSFEDRFVFYKLSEAPKDNPFLKNDIINFNVYNAIRFTKAQKIHLKIDESNYIQNERNTEKMYVTIRGLNILGQYIEEQVKIKHAGFYSTNNYFLCICNNNSKPAIERHGFNGAVSLMSIPGNSNQITHDFKPIVRDKISEIGEAFEKFDSRLIIENKGDTIEYKIRMIDDPFVYVNTYSNEVYKVISSQKVELLPDEIIDDLDFNNITDNLMGITNKGYIINLPVGLTEMTPAKLLPKTIEFDIGFETDAERFSINETIQLRIPQLNIANKVQRLLIIIERPDGTLQFVKNKDGEIIADNLCQFIEPKNHVEIEKIWQSIFFDLTLNDYGQWNFYSLSYSSYVMSKTVEAFTREFIESDSDHLRYFRNIRMYIDRFPHQKDLLINSHSVKVESIAPINRWQVLEPRNNYAKNYIHQEGFDNEFIVSSVYGNKITNKKRIKFSQDAVLFEKETGDLLLNTPTENKKIVIEYINKDIEEIILE